MSAPGTLEDSAGERTSHRDRINALRQRISSLRADLESCENELSVEIETASSVQQFPSLQEDPPSSKSERRWPLQAAEYRRYGRQMIVPQIGLQGQLDLRSSRVLIVGLGGLGCPAAIYLAGAGVSTLGLVDGDVVEESNLHRQILHLTKNVGMNKARSAAVRCRELNPLVDYKVYEEELTPASGLNMIDEDRYDLLLDCTDRPETRYMLSDVAVAAGVPLVTASALKTDGQLMVLNYPPVPRFSTLASDSAVHDSNAEAPDDAKDAGFCYRCVFPTPPPASSVQPCSDAGIIGPVVGTMGTLMATEAIRMLSSETSKPINCPSSKTMLLYSAYSSPPFRSVRLKGRRNDCIACGDFSSRKITRETLLSAQTEAEYVRFCGSEAAEKGFTVKGVPQISARDFAGALNHANGEGQPTQDLIIDVRPETGFGIASLPDSINIPLSRIERDPQILNEHLNMPANSSTEASSDHKTNVFMVCRYGIDSKLATKLANDFVTSTRSAGEGAFKIVDVAGGLRAWRDQVDATFPEY